MKRMGWVLLVGFLATAFLPAGAWAKVVEPWEAREAGENFLNQITKTEEGWGTAKDARVLDCVEFTGERGRLGYFIPVHPKGYIMVSLLTQLLPIKAWSAECNLDITEEGGMTQLLRDTMGGTLDYIEEAYGSLDQAPEEGIAPASNREEWDFLWGKGPQPLNENGEPRVYTIGGLLPTSWWQGAPYNNNCPVGCSSTRSYVGCVATAASQIMKFWNYPSTGTGSHTYHWAGDNSTSGGSPCCANQPQPPGGADLTATFSDAYDWANMLNSYAGGYTATQAAAVAELCSEVGIAFNMEYGVCASGAFTSDAATVFPTYFKYANTTGQKDRDAYGSQISWWNEIQNEFDVPMPRPAQYRIAGHSIVCDGYRDDPPYQVHIIYGWQDTSKNTWYTVDNIYGDSSPMDDYIVYGIQPQNRLYFIIKGGSNNAIYQKYIKSNGTIQANNQQLSGLTDSAPALAVFNNRLYAAIKGSGNNNIYVSSRSHAFNWTSWSQIPGMTNRSPALAAFNNRLYLAVKGATNNNIYLKSMNSSGVWDASWTTVAGLTGDSPALACHRRYLWMAVKGATNNSIYFKSMNSSGSWGSWHTVPGGLTGAAPAMVSWGNAAPYSATSLIMAVKGATNNNIYVTSTDTGEFWSSFSIVSGLTSTSPALAVMPETNRLYLAVKGATNNSIYTRYDAWGKGWSWSSWVTPPALTSDTPSIHTFYYYEP